MNTTNNIWKLQATAFNDGLNDALQQQHQAAQFIALVGHHLIPQKADDSNTNMEYIPSGKLLQGNAIPNGTRLTLQMTDLKLNILDKENVARKTISLNGKTKQVVFDELKKSLLELGVDVSTFKNELHYEIPSHPLDEGAVFSVKNEFNFIENANYRHNAKIVLNGITGFFEQKEPIRIWPHHFDTGAFFVISKNEKGETTQTIGIGWAMPDSMVNEPYYYLSFWSEKPIDGLEDLSPTDAGLWMMPTWNGAVLSHSEISKEATLEGQHELVKSFFDSGIEILLNKIKTKQ